MAVQDPKGEIVWVRYFDLCGCPKFLLTSKPSREYYLLYKIDGDKLIKLGRAKTPIELEEKYGVITHLGETS